jgi:predicted metal-dependent peptidase
MEKLTAIKKIEKAKVGLYLDAPFWASIALRLELVEDKAGLITQTMATDGKQIVFYPPFVDQLSLDECKGVLAHEVGHVILLHPFRRQKRELKKFNIACDYAVNPLLLSTFKLPAGHLDNSTYHNMEAEAIYNALPPEPKPKKGQGQPQGEGQQQGQQPCPDPGGTGGVMDYPGNSTQTKQAELEQKMYNVQAAQIAKRQGNLPAGLDRLIEELTEPKLDWKEILARFVDSNSRNDYTWKLPNRKFITSGFFLPRLQSPELGHVVCLIDASGSVSGDELKALVSEVQGMLELYTAQLSIIFFDTSTSDILEITDDTELKGLKILRMGGGTDYRPPFEKVIKEGLDPIAIIVLTDGCCNSFSTDPQAPTLWIINNKRYFREFKPPFGETLYMEGEEENEKL